MSGLNKRGNQLVHGLKTFLAGLKSTTVPLTDDDVITKGYFDTATPLVSASAADARIELQKGTANGIAELDESSKVPSSQLPSYVDDVLEYDDLTALPPTGSVGIIYVTLDTNLTYRWSGTAYIMIGNTLTLGESSTNAYRGDRGKTAYDHSQLVTGNPHGVTKTDLSLNNVDNTSDVNKPVSTAQQTALNAKEPTLTKGNLAETTSSILTIVGGSSSQIGTGTTIQVKQASTSQSGYLSSTDYSNLILGTNAECRYKLVTDLIALIGASNVKLLMLYDQFGASTTLTDRSGNAHNGTLSANGSTLTPAYQGLLSNLTFSNSAYTTVANHADFDFKGTAPNDLSFSIIWVGIPTSFGQSSSDTLLSKLDVTTGATKEAFWFGSGARLLTFRCYTNSTGAYVDRHLTTSINGDAGSLMFYAGTKGAARTAASIKVYRGYFSTGVIAQVDNQDGTSGSYAGLETVTSNLSDSYIGSNGSRAGFMNAKNILKIVTNSELSLATLTSIFSRINTAFGTY